MIALDPAARPSFDLLLHTSRGTVFPECFYSFLHNYLSSLNDLPTPSPFAMPTAAMLAPSAAASPHTPSGASPKAPSTLGNLASTADESSGRLPNDSDRRIEQLWRDFESVEPYLAPDTQEEPEDRNIRIDYAAAAAVGKAFQVFFLSFVITFRLTYKSMARTYSQLNFKYPIARASLRPPLLPEVTPPSKVRVYYLKCAHLS